MFGLLYQARWVQMADERAAERSEQKVLRHQPPTWGLFSRYWIY